MKVFSLEGSGDNWFDDLDSVTASLDDEFRQMRLTESDDFTTAQTLLVKMAISDLLAADPFRFSYQCPQGQAFDRSEYYPAVNSHKESLVMTLGLLFSLGVNLNDIARSDGSFIEIHFPFDYQIRPQIDRLVLRELQMATYYLGNTDLQHVARERIADMSVLSESMDFYTWFSTTFQTNFSDEVNEEERQMVLDHVYVANLAMHGSAER